MAITQAMCTSFKKELLEGVHNFKNSGGSTFKLALFTSSATLGAATTAYATTNEVTGTNYTAGGVALGSVTLTLGDNSSSVPTAYLDFADSTWSTSTISSAMGALIYNSSLSGASTGSTTTAAAYPAVAMFDFVTAKSSSAGDFTIQWPANDANNAAIRIA